MFKTIAARLTLTNLILVLLIVGIVGSTIFVLERQKDDGLVVNLSGRQRMLTQRMAHQLLGFSRLRDQGKTAQAERQALLLTLQVFEKTLEALDHGGPAPMDLQLVNLRQTPPASAAVSAQLARVRGLYWAHEKQARIILDGTETERHQAEAYIIENNSELLSEMNTAVSILQSEAEARVKQLYYIQGGALVLALLVFWLLSSYVERTIVEPLRRLAMLADAISRGEVNFPVEVGGAKELVRLGASVERLRVAMKNLIPSGETAELAGL